MKKLTLRKAMARKEGTEAHHRNMRNNNPGNISYGEFAKAHGGIREVHAHPRFAVFPDMDTGWEAMRQLIHLHVKRKKGMTLSQLIHKWAPPTENDTLAYIEFVCYLTGLEPDTVLTEEIINA